jgi:hypothetical protein
LSVNGTHPKQVPLPLKGNMGAIFRWELNWKVVKEAGLRTRAIAPSKEHSQK